MKRIIIAAASLLLIVSLLAGCAQAAPQQPQAPGAAEQPPQPAAEQSAPQPAASDISDETLKARIDAMLPAMDSIVRAMGVTGDAREYRPRDPECFWPVLYLMAMNWESEHPLTSVDGDRLIVPRKLMQELASAAFFDYDDLLADVPSGFSEAAVYDEALDAYRLALSDAGDSYTEIESFEKHADGSLGVTVGMYAGREEYLGGIRFTLRDNPYVSGITQPTYYYSVSDAVHMGDGGWRWETIANATKSFDIDLDGDGLPDMVSITPDEDAYTTDITFRFGSGEEVTRHYDYEMYGINAHFTDITAGDGRKELVLAYTFGSDDYCTSIYWMQDGRLQESENYVYMTGLAGESRVWAETVVDILGTYGADVKMELSANGAAAVCSPYTITHTVTDWEYALHLVKSGFPVRRLTDARSMTLDAGTRLALRETDEESYVILEAQDGTQYRAEVSRAAEGWGWEIDGVNEEDWFEVLMYAG